MNRSVIECRDGFKVRYEYWDEKECHVKPDIWEEKLTSLTNDCDAVILNIRGNIAGEKKSGLTHAGFIPVGHSINMVYRIRQKNGVSSHRFSFTFAESWSIDEVFEVARWHFSNDSRFCIDGGREECHKNELLYEYIKMLRRGGYEAELMHRDGVLQGFNLWRREDSESARIHLGAIHPKLKGIGIAFYLYDSTLQDMRSKGIKVLSEWVSTSNLESLNLHNKLFGGNFKYTGSSDTWLLFGGHKCH